MSDEDLFAWMESHMGLHRTVEFLYAVDRYYVSLTDNDGATVIAKDHGPTLREAVANLMTKWSLSNRQ